MSSLTIVETPENTLSIIESINTVGVDVGDIISVLISGGEHFANLGSGIILSAGGSSQSNGTIEFINSNGVSFGLHNGQLTASAIGGGGGANVGVSAGTTSVSLGTLNLSNGNGISFGLNGSTLTASHNGLTTAMQSQMSSNYMSTSERGNYFATNAYTFANSTHTHGNPALNLTNLSGTTASGSNGFTLSLSAAAGGGGADGYNIIGVNGVSVASAATLQLSNSNNISFGLNGSTITASATFNQSIQPVAFSAGNGSAAFSTLKFADSQGISFSTGTQGIFATVKTDFLTTAAQSNHSHGNPSLNLTNISGTTASNSAGLTLSLSAGAIPGTTSFSNSNGISFGLNGSTLTASHNGLTTAMASNASTAFAGTGSGFTGSSISATITHNTLGLSLSLNHPAWLSTAMQSQMSSNYMSTSERGNYFATNAYTFANSTHTHGNPTLALTNISGTTASASNGLTLSLSVNPGGGGPASSMAYSGSNASSTANTLVFGNSNGLSFYITNGSIVGSYTDAGAGGGITAVRLSAGSTNSYGSNFSFANSNGVSFGINGQTITASANAGGAGNIDGGDVNAVYLTAQYIDGGGA